MVVTLWEGRGHRLFDGDDRSLQRAWHSNAQARQTALESLFRQTGTALLTLGTGEDPVALMQADLLGGALAMMPENVLAQPHPHAAACRLLALGSRLVGARCAGGWSADHRRRVPVVPAPPSCPEAGGPLPSGPLPLSGSHHSRVVRWA